jgi:hypothetical protein
MSASGGKADIANQVAMFANDPKQTSLGGLLDFP